jgi:uncharacterized protein (TIGR02117 family)
MHRASLLFFSFVLCLCATAPGWAAQRSVYLVNIGWHAGIVVPVDAALRRAMPEVARFPNVTFIAIGWGDSEFYQAKDPGPFIAMKAALFPTNAVVHLNGFSRPVAEEFARLEVLEFMLSDEEFAALFGHIHATFQRGGDNGASEPLGQGLFGASSQFYKATGEFHMMRTCNTWAAEALATAGLDLDPKSIITASGLMQAARAAIEKRPKANSEN